jgi:predicted ABC-type sugar transport system permease subunit
MADIRIEQRKGPPVWVWVVVVLALVLIVWFVIARTNRADVPQPIGGAVDHAAQLHALL